MATTELQLFSALDRCDRCPAQALVETRHGDSHLLWCNHHFNASRPTDRGGVVTRDERTVLAVAGRPIVAERR